MCSSHNWRRLLESYLPEIIIAAALFIIGQLFILANRVKDLWDWHNINDEEGVKIWYVRKSLEDAVKDMAASTNKIATVLDRMAERDILILRVLEKLENNANRSR
ncbi:MAG: hypothetical protein COA94_04735 [Rickettsiales bacterium]|nr:MAG: hypothetical protein COA94_04735 [Rickettsiales bacterium]